MNNYQTIVLSGQTYPIAFIAGAFVRFQRKTGKPFFQSLEGIEGNMEDMAALVAAGLECGAQLAGSPRDFDTLQAADLFSFDQLPEIMEILTSYLPKIQPGEMLATVVASPSTTLQKKQEKPG